MKKLFTGLIVWFSLTASAATEQAMVIESQTAIKEFSTRLKNELQKGMQAGGPVAAIQICNLVAEDIADEVSQQYGWKLARTSLKVRNPKNAPDKWETRILKSFDARRATGEDPKTITFHQLINEDGTKTFRHMQAIPTGGVCLACHGDQIAPEISAKLQETYPQDQATGFKIGDLRGAFTITRIID